MNRPIRPNRPGLQGSSRNTALLAGGGTLFELKAAPDTTTSTSLTWNEAVPKPDNYRVERSLNGTTFSTVTTLANTVFDYNDTGRTESTQYWYRIVPILGGADQPASNVADTWTVPATPTGLTATAISSTQINLAWTDVSTGNTAQSIQRRSPAGSGSYSFIAAVGATANSYSDTGLTLATQYEYQVAATNPATQSAWSTAANATTTGGGPPSPSWTLDFSTGEPWANGTNYTFSSTASTTRTYVDSSGYIAPSVANLMLRSQDFTTTWTSLNASVDTNGGSFYTAPDGLSTASKINQDTATGAHSIRQTFTAAVTTYTGSVYAKKQTTSGVGRYLTLIHRYDASSYAYATFDLDSGTVSQAGTVVGFRVLVPVASIVSVGSGWYRCILRARWDFGIGSASLVAALANTGTPTSGEFGQSFTGANATDGVYLWGAQMVVGSEPLPYSATTTSSNGIPRLTHNSSGSRLGLLVEGQRTNLALNSEDGASGIDQSGSTNTNNYATAPSNTTTAARWQVPSTGWRLKGTNSSPAGTYTCSFYIKQNTVAQTVRLRCLGNVSGTPVEQTISTTADWQRISLTFVSATTQAIRIGLDQRTIVGGPGTSADVLVWGFQVEEASTASSYIPTTTASVTRSADLAYVETADVTNWGRPGSFVVEYYKPLEQSGGVVVADDDGAGNAGRLGLEYSAGGPRIVYGTSGAGSGGTDTAGLNKIGWAWNGSGASTRSALNGSALDTSLETSFDPTLTDGINLGGNIDWTALPLTVSGQPNVVIRRVRFWNSQLSAADLNTLTT